jgi:MerR family transcriptional regulator, heat shock protein HspR
MSKEKYDTEPRYVISVAARMLETQTHTLRYYEKVGIIEPRRSRGNVRLYSDSDIAVLHKVKSLVDDLGINLPGVEVILHMMEQMSEMQKELQRAQQEIDKLRQGEDI